MKLNLGCQVHYFPGWTNVDIVGDDPNIKVDIEADAGSLPMISDNSVDFIYAGHLVEHFYPDTLGAAIKEWYRILKPGGTLVIVTPDSGAVMRDYAAGKLNIEQTWQQIYGRIYHYDAAPERHHIAFDYQTLEKFCIARPPLEHAWANIQHFNFHQPPEELVPMMDTHISRGAYQLGIILTK